MRSQRRSVGVATALATALLTICALIGLSATSSAAKKQKVRAPLPGLAIGVDDTGLNDARTAPLALTRSREIGASYVRVVAYWSAIAPAGTTKPAGFDPRSPADPQYKWAVVDGQVKRAAAAGFTPYVVILNAPKWAQNGTPPASAYAGGGAWKPSAAEFGNFAHAAAVRYSGSYSDATSGGILPNVSVWQAWNEPNLPLFLAPTSPELYRGLLNSMYDEVKAVQPKSTIVTAGLAPVKSSTPAAFPKDFAQQLLCLKPSNGWFDKDPSCPGLAKFDVLSLHPYSLRAKPTQRAAVIGNMFVADTNDLSQMLKAAGANNSVSPGAKRLWITEFAWFTNPPSKSVGDPPDVAGKRTAISLYLLWHAGVTQITWFAISDNSGAIVKGGGLFDSGGRAKPTYYALRFPFFVRQDGRKLLIWGRSPVGSSRTVSIKALRNGNYKRITTVKPSKGGVFQKRITLKSRKTLTLLAQQGGERSPKMGSRDFFEN
ncbi:MAG: hypothetical protein JHC98_04945 [Thermoleophilaceae bacterium]|nr:hypothetical protein [Thermoleophilaceae bacterium]